jgi:Cellulase (glycosyl hydrolase family 5)/Concanavalin A-like lectin/glucanases superfamily/Chitobiase/beta-hexosaminidase C-terminal domain
MLFKIKKSLSNFKENPAKSLPFLRHFSMPLIPSLCFLLFCGNALAVLTPHIWDRDTQGEYANQIIYVKGPNSGGPDNSPLHESWNLTDEYIESVPNPYYIGNTDADPAHDGLFYRFIFYDGTLHIDPNSKVGFWEKMFASGNDSTTYGTPQKGTVNVEGHLFGPELRPWKNGCSMELNVWGNGFLEISNILRVGVSDGGVNTGIFNLSGGLAKLNDLDIYGDDSYIDITGGELLILNSNFSIADASAAILGNKIINTSGKNLNVTTKIVGDNLYTSVIVNQSTPPLPDYSVRVHCSGRNLLDGDDNQLQLRGIYSRAAWMLDGGGEQDIVKLKNWGCNFMRITVPFDSDYWNTVNGGVFDINKRGILREQDLSQMDYIVNWCEENEMYFMFCQQPTYQGFDFDLLGYSPTDPSLYAQQMADIATTFAQRYKDYDYLLGYEPFGEPHGINTTAEYAAYKQICTAYVDAIRAIDPGRIVSIAACDGYAYPDSLINAIRIERDNIIYTFSYYPCRAFVSYRPWYGDLRYPGWIPDFYRDRVIWLDNEWLWTFGMNDAVDFSEDWTVPVYCHEFGAWNQQWNGSSPDSSSDRYIRDMVQLFEDNSINWIIWRWQENANDVPSWWKDLWGGQENNRVTIEPHGGDFIGSENISMHTFVENTDIYYTTDGSNPDESSTLYTGAFSITSGNTIKAKIIEPPLLDAPVDTAVFTEGGQDAVTLTNAVSGLRYWYYEGEWNTTPDFDTLQADSTGTCTTFSPYQNGFSGGKALLWKGYINISQGSVYYFNSRVDAAGGMKMSIGDQQVILNGSDTGVSTTYSVGRIVLEAGMHPIELGYTWPTGASSLFDIEIQRPGDTQFVNIPSSMLYYDNTIPGQAANPAPSDDDTDVPINRDLRWTAGEDTVSHDLYFGKTDPPPFIKNQSGAMYDPGVMDTNSIYYWRVDEKNSQGTTAGDVWSFRTGSDKYLVGWWKFDESFGDIAMDSSGIDNNGELKNMDSSAWVAGRNGNSLDFDGYDDYVWVPYNSSLDLGTGDFSLSIWVKKDSIGTDNKYLYNQRLDGLNWLYLQWRSTNIIESIIKISGTERLSVRSSSPLSAGTWYHVVLVVDRDSLAGTKIYVNNVNNTSGIPNINTVDYSLGAGVSIGRWSGGGGENWDGIMDDFRLYSWALSEDEVRSLYEYGFIQGDIDKSDEVNNIDLASLKVVWTNNECSDPDWCQGGDIDKNGYVNTVDLIILAEHWLERID